MADARERLIDGGRFRVDRNRRSEPVDLVSLDFDRGGEPWATGS